MVKKKSMGRQKIEMKKIEKKSSLEVAFSKRRTGLFKKAGELCVLCGAKAVIIVFSPGRRAFVFGHPSINAVIDRFLEREKDSRARVPEGQVLYEHVHRQYLEALGRLEGTKERARVPEGQVLYEHVHRQYLEALGRLEGTKEHEEAANGDVGFWWDAAIESMGLNELEQFGRSLEELMKKGAVQLEMMMMMEGGPSSTTMVEYAPPLPTDYSSVGVPHGHDLAAYGVPQGFKFRFSSEEPLF